MRIHKTPVDGRLDLIPIHDRDYSRSRDVLADWIRGVPFTIVTPGYGRHDFNCNDALVSSVATVRIRFHHETKAVTIAVDGETLPTSVVESAPVAPSPTVAPEAPAAPRKRARKAPAVEAPAAPAVEAPKVASKVEAPAVEAPAVEAPAAPVLDSSKVEQMELALGEVRKAIRRLRRTYIPGVARARKEAAPAVASKVEAPKVDASKVEAPKVEAPKVASKVEAPAVEAPKVEAPESPVDVYVRMLVARRECEQKAVAGEKQWVDASAIMARECAAYWNGMSRADRMKVAARMKVGSAPTAPAVEAPKVEAPAAPTAPRKRGRKVA